RSPAGDVSPDGELDCSCAVPLLSGSAPPPPWSSSPRAGPALPPPSANGLSTGVFAGGAASAAVPVASPKAKPRARPIAAVARANVHEPSPFGPSLARLVISIVRAFFPTFVHI